MTGQVIMERYELEELVGSGGMSSVFRAHDRLLERKVALKILHEHYTGDEEYVERFRREARAVARLSHPNIVTVIDRGEAADGRQFIVFELVDGQNLKELIEETGPLPVRQAIELALEVARALAFAHEHGLVHRDVKPQNVLMNGDGRPKVTDFGIARSLDVEHGVTQTGTVLGTSNYIAPEQARGERVDEQSDVYSLGVVVFEMLTGSVPFPGDNFVSVAMKHINEPPPDVRELRPDVPPRLAAAVDRALAKAPRDRWPSMGAFTEELEAALREVDDAPDPDATMVQPRAAAVAPRRARGRRAQRRGALWPLLVLLAGLAALVAVAFLALGGDDDGGKGGAAAGGAAVPLTAIRSWDPESRGDGTEHESEVPNATDRNRGTTWSTESYDDKLSLIKSGVGLMVDAGRAVELGALTVVSPTPGFTAEVQVGDSRDGPFAPVTDSKTATGTTTWKIEQGSGRYWVLWITDLPGGGGGSAEVAEITAKARN
jgi:serine/threonine-protein kinase